MADDDVPPPVLPLPPRSQWCAGLVRQGGVLHGCPQVGTEPWVGEWRICRSCLTRARNAPPPTF